MMIHRDHLLNISFLLVLLVLTIKPALLWSSFLLQEQDRGDNHHEVEVIILQETSSLCATILRWVAAAILLHGIHGECHFLWLRRKMPPYNALGYSWPFIGQFQYLVLGDTRQYFVQSAQASNYQPFVWNAFMKPSVCYFSVDDAKWVYSEERKGHLAPFSMPHLKLLFGEETILMKSGQSHRRLTRILTPAFTTTAVKGYLPHMDQTIQQALKLWYSNSSTKTCTMKDVASMTHRVFFQSAFPELDRTTLDVMENYMKRWISGMSALCPYPIPGLAMDKGMKAKHCLQDTIKELIDEYKRSRSSSHPHDSTSATQNVVKEDSLIGRLCYATDGNGKTLTEKELLQNFVILAFAGQDTTSNAVGSMIYHWATSLSSKVQQELRAEADSLKEPLDFLQIRDEAPLINAFLAELLRLEAPVNAHPLVVPDHQQQSVEHKTFSCPPGTGVVLLLANGHYDVGRFPNPSRFDMTRFLPEQYHWMVQDGDDSSHVFRGDGESSKKNHEAVGDNDEEMLNYNTMSASYRTFNHGMHSCIGHTFAKLELRLFFVRFLQSYDVRLHRNEDGKVKQNHFPTAGWAPEFQVVDRHCTASASL